MNNPYKSPATEAGLSADRTRPRTIYHLTSMVAGLAWLTAICYAIKVFQDTGASLAPPFYASAVQGSVLMSLIVWSAFVRTWRGDSRRLCLAFTLALIGIQAAAIFAMRQ
ncbi:hypothetical protein Rcae01_01993 [Novipirellula caenicola]|uniref:Uncharacterized protein n=1 Tax=Novipirellula caenicola TaxID=1536901 RepID=A0ABP9VQF4_9BACT